MTVDLHPRFTFEAFVVGASNRLAVAAARTVAESPGTAYNPLFIYSASGLGKTHLMMAIGHLATQVSPRTVVEYLTLEEFVEAYHAAVAAGQSEAFRNRFIGVDLLLLDDVQFLADRRETQAELLRFVNTFLEAGRQVILTCDRPPNEIADLDERLISRFAGGLVVDMGAPEFETRLAILKRKADERGMVFQPAVLDAVAGIDVRSVRELLGLLNRLIAFQAVNEGEITPEAAHTLLFGETAAPKREAPEAEIPDQAPPAAAAPDEFAQFISTVGSTLAQQLEAWRMRLREAAVFWEGQGYRPRRILALLEGEESVESESVLETFERDVDRLRELEAEMVQLDTGRAGDAVFHDPDRLAEAETMVRNARDGLAPPPGPSAAWAFEDFIAADSNKLALKAARTVAEKPGALYNPLVLVGPTGVGKTHLLHAVGHALSAAPGALVACLSAQDFLDDLVQAIERERMDAWRSRFRRASAFLLDDLHLLAGKERSQEELFHLFNILLETDRQLVFTLNAPPKQLVGVDQRLITRLEGGLVAPIAPPDRELRLAVIVRELAERVGDVDDALAAYLADRPAESLRSVQGLVQRVVSAAESQNESVSVSLARETLEGTGYAPRRASTGMRTSGIVVSPSGGIRSREKVVWTWPNPADRVIEEVG
ncbi:MAG TPA: DnaA/Hda family protein [Gemmatimonadales bacterium]|nr:DnaA/Hda family protein [Gemmatimonadales bacterium]